MESTKFFIDKKVKLANAKEALCMVEGPASEDRSAICSAIEDHVGVLGDLTTPSAKLGGTKGLLTPTFDNLKRDSSTVGVVKAAVQERMKSNLRHYIRTATYQVH